MRLRLMRPEAATMLWRDMDKYLKQNPIYRAPCCVQQ
jgi:hypothetical protein